MSTCKAKDPQNCRYHGKTTSSAPSAPKSRKLPANDAARERFNTAMASGAEPQFPAYRPEDVEAANKWLARQSGRSVLDFQRS